MTNYLFLLLNKFKSWREAKATESKQPLSRENAYVLSTIGNKHGKYSEITENYHKIVLQNIETAAKLGDTYLLQKHPSCLSPSDKEELVDFLANLGYNVLFFDSRVLLITWIYPASDYQKQ